MSDTTHDPDADARYHAYLAARLAENPIPGVSVTPPRPPAVNEAEAEHLRHLAAQVAERGGTAVSVDGRSYRVGQVGAPAEPEPPSGA